MTSLLEQLNSDRPAVVWWEAVGAWSATPDSAVRALLPGSFNPLHPGHLQLQATAAALLGEPVAFELARANADKPSLSRGEIERRCRQFDILPANSAAVAVTNAATFVEKSVLFPGVTFVVGADTALRILEARFYANDRRQLDLGLAKIADQGCRFLVAARWWEGRLLRLDDLAIPSAHRPLFEAIPPDQFRLDLSSTQLRSQD